MPFVTGTTEQQPWEAAKEHRGAWVEVSEERWEYCLNVLPPIYFRGGFAVSEASWHTAGNVPVYLCLVTVKGTRYAQELTIAEAVKEAAAIRLELGA
jgi:hypothetical protein